MTPNLPRRILLWTAAGLVLLIAAGVVASLGSHGNGRPNAAQTPPKPPAKPRRHAVLEPVRPLVTEPAQTPVQEQYDDALVSGLGSSESVKLAEAARVPEPAFSAGLPALAEANTPEAWVQEFTQALLDIDFTHQSRATLGAWVSAETAPELLPGVPADAADKVLYLSLFDAGAMGSSSPIPDQSTWADDARSGVRWSVSDVTVQTDPEYSKVVATGWQPPDERFVVEDVTGLLKVTSGGSVSQRTFSMAVYTGSAHWHHGYGTVLVDDWKET